MKLHSLRTPLPGAALFGKLPCALDFVRVNHDSAESIALDRWLQAAMQRLTARNRLWPTGQLIFTLTLDAQHSLVAVVADSRDRAGRRFPLAVYARVPRPLSRWGSGALVLASEPFVEAASALLADAAQLSLTQVPLRLRRLRPPLASDVQAATEQLMSELATRSLAEFAGPLFAAAPAPAPRARAALEQLKQRRSRAGNAFECFDCPIESARDVAVWASWLERAHGQPCAALWQVSGQLSGQLPGQARALLAPGSLPERAPLFWGLPALSHPSLCRIGEDMRHDGSAGADEGGERSLCSVFEEVAGEAGHGIDTIR